MGNWADLHSDVLNLVADRLTIAADRAGFNGVCRNWSSVAQSKPNYLPCNPPWLILVENPSCSRSRAFVGLTDVSLGKESFDLDLPEAIGTRFLGSTGCWLVMIDADVNMFILNPFTRKKIELPPLRAFPDYNVYFSHKPSIMSNLFLRNLFLRDHFVTGKVCLSFPLNKSPLEALVAVAIYYGNSRLAYAKKGDKSWTKIETTRSCFLDVAFYQGKFYAVNGFGTVSEFSISFKPQGKPQLMPVSDILDIRTTDRYLVEFEGMLLQVVRHVSIFGEPQGNDDYDYITDSVDVFELDFLTGGWKEVNDLGQHSIFAGINTSVSLLASCTNSSSFRPNCIYFTDDYRLGYLGDRLFQGGRDTIVYNLADRTIQPLYSGGRYSLSSFSPPIWVIPTSMYHTRR